MAALRTLALWSLAGVAVAPFDAMHVATGTVVHRVGGSFLELCLFAAAGVVVGAVFKLVCVPLGLALGRARPREEGSRNSSMLDRAQERNLNLPLGGVPAPEAARDSRAPNVANVERASVEHANVDARRMLKGADFVDVAVGSHATARNREALRALAAERRSRQAATVRTSVHDGGTKATVVVEGAPAESRTHRAFSIAAFLVAYLASSFAEHHAPIATALFAALAVVSLALTPPERIAPAIVLSIGAAVLGPVVEGALSSAGAFDYTHPDLGRVPLWLPALYLLLGPAVAALDAAFTVVVVKPALIRRASHDFVRSAWLRTSRRRHV